MPMASHFPVASDAEWRLRAHWPYGLTFYCWNEPFAGIDPISVGDIQQIIAYLRDSGIGVLITDHNVRETLGICDRAYILSNGKVLTAGSPDDILSHAEVREVYLGEHFRL